MTEDVEMLKGLTLRNPVSILLLGSGATTEIPSRPSFAWKRTKTKQPTSCNTPSGILLSLLWVSLTLANALSYRCSEVDKFLLTYVILKLKLIKGKCILFVNDVDRCYRLKLFLEQFSIKSCVLNSELPLNSRCVISAGGEVREG